MFKFNKVCERPSQGVHKDRAVQRENYGKLPPRISSSVVRVQKEKFNRANQTQGNRQQQFNYPGGIINTICNGSKLPKERCLIEDRSSTPTDGK